MKIRSKALWQYLSETGALNGTVEEIATAKKKYRQNYKRTWKQNRIIRKIELRPGFTDREFKELAIRAQAVGLTPTALVREHVLSYLQNSELIPNRNRLLKVLQLISMAIINSADYRTQQALLQEAERLLLSYLKSD